MAIHKTIMAFMSGMKPHDRLRSWDHCYRYFHSRTSQEIAHDLDHAALRLGFYLASWGMYRGSGFLIECDYTIHRDVIERLTTTRYDRLWQEEFGSGNNDADLLPIIQSAVAAVREGYEPYAREHGSRGARVCLVAAIGVAQEPREADSGAQLPPLRRLPARDFDGLAEALLGRGCGR